MEYNANLSLDLTSLVKSEYEGILERAEMRVRKALEGGYSDKDLSWGDKEYAEIEEEIVSFPVAVLMISRMEENYAKRLFAESEAKRITGFLKEESREKLIEISKSFRWDMEGDRTHLKLHFTDYLRNTSHLRDKKWKLINRLMKDGRVFITQYEAARLMEEEARRYVEELLNRRVEVTLPEDIAKKVEELKHAFLERKGKTNFGRIPKDVKISAFPPCIKKLYEATKAGRRMSHIGRFTLTSFLLNVGFTPEETINLFNPLSDFSERMTRYQVEHIAGDRGSRTKYLSPSCSTLKTHGVCVSPDKLCQRIKHPLTYYKRKHWGVTTKTSGKTE